MGGWPALGGFWQFSYPWKSKYVQFFNPPHPSLHSTMTPPDSAVSLFQSTLSQTWYR